MSQYKEGSVGNVFRLSTRNEIDNALNKDIESHKVTLPGHGRVPVRVAREVITAFARLGDKAVISDCLAVMAANSEKIDMSGAAWHTPERQRLKSFIRHDLGYGGGNDAWDASVRRVVDSCTRIAKVGLSFDPTEIRDRLAKMYPSDRLNAPALDNVVAFKPKPLALA